MTRSRVDISGGPAKPAPAASRAPSAGGNAKAQKVKLIAAVVLLIAAGGFITYYVLSSGDPTPPPPPPPEPSSETAAQPGSEPAPKFNRVGTPAAR